MIPPVRLRNSLHKLFVQALERADPADWLEKASRTLGRDEEAKAYFRDRLPRYRRVLEVKRPREDTLRSAIRLGQDLFNAGLFFDCHERLESSWMRAEGPEKELLQGLIQLGAALHKIELRPDAKDGPLWSLAKALQRLEAGRMLIGAGPEALETVREIRRRLEQERLDLDDLPTLALLPPGR